MKVPHPGHLVNVVSYNGKCRRVSAMLPGLTNRVIDTVSILAICLVIQRMMILEVVTVILGFLLMAVKKNYLSKHDAAVASTQTENEISNDEVTKRIAREVMQEMECNGSHLSTSFYTQWGPQQYA